MGSGEVFCEMRDGGLALATCKEQPLDGMVAYLAVGRLNQEPVYLPLERPMPLPEEGGSAVVSCRPDDSGPRGFASSLPPGKRSLGV